MKILITNDSLHSRGGTESFVRDLARGLQGLGHSVIAFSSDPRQRERLLENDVIPVTTDLENLPFLPDVIHGQHHLDAMTALTALPGVPVLYHSHGATWRGYAPRHPRIYRYLAMSRTLGERLAAESNIAPERITVFLNSVDMARFSKIRKLPPHPARALFYNGRHAPEGDTISAIREACSRCGLELDLLGRSFGTGTDEPEKVLPTYDIVFASGISAIEALACGCAVVVLGRTSAGEMVQAENFDRIRQVNFSIASNSPPPSADNIERELRRFSAMDGAIVTERVRREANFSESVRKLVTIYEQVIELHRNSEADLRAEILATSRYLRTIVPLIKVTDTMLDGNWSSETRANSFEELSARVVVLEQQMKRAS